MRQHVKALHQLARIAIQGSADEETLARAARIIRGATGAAEAMVVYAEEKDFLVCSDAGNGAATEFTQTALWIVQRQIVELDGPVAFNLIGHRVEDFTSARSDEERDFLALSMPTSEGASEMCILRGSPDHKGRATILRFMESATPALTIILERFLNIGRSRRYGEKLSALANAAQLLAQSDDLQAALTDLATAIAGSTASDYVSIDVYDADSKRFVLRVLSQSRFAGLSVTQAWINSLDPDRPAPRNLEVMRTLQPYLSPDTQNDEREPEAVRRYFEATLIRSMATFPMLFQDEFLGTVAFVYYAPHTFLPEEISFLQGFVTQAATALKALQMHNELQRSTYELKRSADEYIATTNLTGDIIARLDKHGNWTFLNDAACQFFGKAGEELLGTDSTAFLHPEDIEPTAQIIRETRARKAPAKGFVNRQFTPMGTRWVEWNGYPLFDEDGQYAGVQITGRDITGHQQMEEALRQSEARYRLLAETTSDIIWIVDLGLKYTYISPAVTRMRGYTVEEIMGASIAETMTPASLEAARKTLAEELARERMGDADPDRATKLELEMYCKDGSTIWTEMNMKFLRDADGNPISILGTTRDISERKRMEEALRESEARYRLLAENASDLIWTLDMNLRYTYMSPSITRMRGYTPEEIVGTRVNETMTPASLEAIRKAFVEEMALEKQEQKDLFRSQTLEAEMYCKDGSTVWTEIKLTFLRDPDGRPVAILGVSRDISERKKAEEERERLHAELEVRAITDGLTGLYNHAHFYQRLAEEIDRSQRYHRGFSIVMMDVDAFKYYNDSRGHQAGDTVLHLIADCIRAAIRRSDTAFRYGGDEFAAILLNADSSRAQRVVNRINRLLAARLKEMDDAATTWLGLSAGVASFPQDATTTDELVRVADAALYDAKRVAWARGITSQDQPVESPPSPIGLVHETQSGMLSTAASSLATVLQDLGTSEVAPEADLRTIAAVGAASEIKDRYIRGHQERAGLWAAALAEEMGLPPEQVRNIRIAGLLHDLGKATVNERILNKPGKLSKEEFAKVKQHAPLGAAIIVAEAEALRQLATIVRHHHERFDGKGYPDSLVGDDIPLEARILAVADVFDALTHERSYRKAQSKEEAVAELERGAGTQFDPAVVKAFLALVKRAGAEPATPAQAASQGNQLVAARAAGRRKG